MNKERNFYLASASYDGSPFNGWAKQPNSPTVQGFIEKQMTATFGTAVKILATSRTDKGVHAIDQKFTFSLPYLLTAQKLKNILSKLLIKFVNINAVRKITTNFHPLHSVRLKEYRYYINTGCYNIFSKNYIWNYNLPIDISKMRLTLKTFEGFHDFFNFSYCRTRNREIENTHKKIEKLLVVRNSDVVVVKIFARSFLRYQVRAMIGEAVAALSNQNPVSTIKEMLSAGILKKYKNLAPASGLYLWKVHFLPTTKKNG